MCFFCSIVGIGTNIDPTLTRADRLVGQTLGDVGELPKIYTEITIQYYLLRHVVGVKNDSTNRDSKVCIFFYTIDFKCK